MLLDLFMIFISFVAAYIPILLYVAFVWWLDRYEREPLPLIAVAFLWGAIGSFALAISFELFTNIPIYMLSNSEEFTFAVSSVLTVPVIEETAKALLLFIFVFYYNFDDMADGIVYGAIIGFGFSASENLLYYVDTYLYVGAVAWAFILVLRTMVTSFAHGIFTAVVGAGLGFAKTTQMRNLRWFIVPSALLLAIFLHSLFNLSILLSEYTILALLFNFSLVLFGVSVILLLLFLALDQESDSIRRGLLPEYKKGLISEGEYNVVPHYLKRKRSARIISRKYGGDKMSLLNRLFNLETRLAFEKEHISKPMFTGFEDVDKRIKDTRKEIAEVRKKLGPALNALGEIK